MFNATAASTPSDCADGAAETDGERRLAMLRRLGEMAMDFAKAVHREAMSQPEAGETPRPIGDLAPVFARIAHAVRQTVALEARLAGDLQIRERREQDAAREGAVRQARAWRKAEVGEIVRRVIEPEKTDCVHSDWFTRLDARLDRQDDDTALADLPLGERVARICRDLGLKPSWTRWDVDWAREAAAAEARRRAVMGKAPRAPMAPTRRSSPQGPPPPDLSG